MRFAHWFLPVLVVVLAACSTTPSSSTVVPPYPPYVAKLESMGVAPTTMQRIKAARVLTFADVLELVKKGVPGDKIVAYMKATRAPYNYTQSQVNALVAAGADSTLVNYVDRAAGDFLIDAQNAAQQERIVQDQKWEREAWRNPYFADMAYWGPPPFAFGWPAVWY